MLIKENDELKVLQFLTYQRWANGNEFVVYLDDGFPTEIQEMICFSTQSEAEDFCKSESTDQDIYRLIGIRSAYRVLADARSAEVPRLHRNGAIDLGAMIDQKHTLLNQQIVTNNKGEKNMEKKEEIFEYLQERLLFTGFSEAVDMKKLKSNINSEKAEFELKANAVKPDGIINATLHFKKSETSDNYFFNSYDAELKKIGEKETIKHTFYINNKGGSITFKEAYNLLQGRSVFKNLVNKDGGKYTAWIQLDTKNPSENGSLKFKYHYNFDVRETLGKYNIKELDNPQYTDSIVKGIEKGNQQMATFVKGRLEEKRLVEANPQFKSFNFYSPETGRQVSVSQKKVVPEKSQDQNQKVAKTVASTPEDKSQEVAKAPEQKDQKESTDKNLPNSTESPTQESDKAQLDSQEQSHGTDKKLAASSESPSQQIASENRKGQQDARNTNNRNVSKSDSQGVTKGNKRNNKRKLSA